MTAKTLTTTMGEYSATIGIECHVQLKTKTKLFSAVGNDARNAEPNTLISHICLGMPGALPVLNEAAVKLAMRSAFALGTKPQTYSYFERKHYFYPDLPKGYQITQLAKPIVKGGFVEITTDGGTRQIQVNRVQIEEDAGKSTHPDGEDYSLVDLNRAGTPLLEIVSEPDMHTAAEAKAYARELYLLMKYAQISDVDLYHGNMRFDVNVSVSKDPKVFGTRTETKNLNSFRSVEKAVEYEIKRQIAVLEEGGEIVQETRGWDDAKQKTFSQRSKEEAHDYRYFPDPDLPPIVLSDQDIADVEASMPVLPSSYRKAFAELGLDSSQVDTLLEEPETSAFLLDIINQSGLKTAKMVANWLTGDIQAAIVAGSLNWNKVLKRPNYFTELADMVVNGLLSSTTAKEVLVSSIVEEKHPKMVAETKNLIQESDENALEEIVSKVLASNEKAAQDVKNGETKAIGFLVGQVMKASQGKANPGIVQSIIKRQLS